MSNNNKFSVSKYISRYVKSKYYYYYSDEVIAELVRKLNGYTDVEKKVGEDKKVIVSYHNYSLDDIMNGKLDNVIDDFLEEKFKSLEGNSANKFNQLLEFLLEEYKNGKFNSILTLELTDDMKKVICLLNGLDTIEGYKVFNDDYVRILLIQTIRIYYEDSLLNENFQLDMEDFKNKLGIIVKSYVYVDDKANIVNRDSLLQKIKDINNGLKRPLNKSTIDMVLNVYFLIFCNNYKFSDFSPVKKDNFLHIIGLINLMVKNYCDELFQIDNNHVLYDKIHSIISNKYLFGDLDPAKILRGELNKELLDIYSKIVKNYNKKKEEKKKPNVRIKYNGNNLSDVLNDVYRRMPRDMNDEKFYIYRFLLEKFNVNLSDDYIDYFSNYIRKINKNATSFDICNGLYDKYLSMLFNRIKQRQEEKNNISNSNDNYSSKKKKPIDYNKRIINYIKNYLINELNIGLDRADLERNAQKIFDRIYRRYGSLESIVDVYNDVVVNHEYDEFIRNIYMRVLSDNPESVAYRKKSKVIAGVSLGLFSLAAMLIVANAHRTGRIMEATKILEMLGANDLSNAGLSSYDTNTPGMLIDYFKNLSKCGDNYWLMFLSEAEKIYNPNEMNELLEELHKLPDVPERLKQMMIDSHGYVSYEAWMKNACEILDKKLPNGIDTEIFQNYCLKNPNETGTLIGYKDVDVDMLNRLKNIYNQAMNELKAGFVADIDNIKDVLETARSIIFKGSDYVGRRL